MKLEYWVVHLHIPLDKNHKLRATTVGVLVDKGRYKRLVGKLIYLSHI